MKRWEEAESSSGSELWRAFYVPWKKWRGFGVALHSGYEHRYSTSAPRDAVVEETFNAGGTILNCLGRDKPQEIMHKYR